MTRKSLTFEMIIWGLFFIHLKLQFTIHQLFETALDFCIELVDSYQFIIKYINSMIPFLYVLHK